MMYVEYFIKEIIFEERVFSYKTYEGYVKAKVIANRFDDVDTFNI